MEKMPILGRHTSFSLIIAGRRARKSRRNITIMKPASTPRVSRPPSTQHVHDDQPVLALGRVVMEAIQLYLVDRRSDSIVRGLDQPEFHVPGGIVDAEEVATRAPLRSQQS